MARTLLASIFPAVAIAAAWSSLEDPRKTPEAAAIAALALLPALLHERVLRAVTLVGTGLAVGWIAFGAQPWGLPAVPQRARTCLRSPREAAQGLSDFYAVFLPFDPVRDPEMHSLVLCAVFAFALATALLVAARRPLAAAAVTVAGVGWPATLVGGRTIAIGAVALAAALAIPLILRAGSARTLALGGVIGVLVVAGAAWTGSVTTLASSGAVDWESWDLSRTPTQASAVQFVWNSNYDGIRFPRKTTVVLRIDGPKVPNYWRTTTLDLFTRDHWFEDLFWLDQVDSRQRALRLAQLVPARAARHQNWLEQRVRIEALVDDHLAAAGTPVGLDARRLGTVFPPVRGRAPRARPDRAGAELPRLELRARPRAACARLGTAALSTRDGALPRDRRPALPPVRRTRARAHGQRDLRGPVRMPSSLRSARSTRSRGAWRVAPRRRTGPCWHSSPGCARRAGSATTSPRRTRRARRSSPS